MRTFINIAVGLASLLAGAAVGALITIHILSEVMT